MVGGSTQRNGQNIILFDTYTYLSIILIERKLEDYWLKVCGPAL
jgi:hypothetical protein